MVLAQTRFRRIESTWIYNTNYRVSASRPDLDLILMKKITFPSFLLLLQKKDHCKKESKDEYFDPVRELRKVGSVVSALGTVPKSLQK